MEKKKESITANIIKDKVYEIRIRGYDIEDSNKKAINIVMWADRWGLDVINRLFRILQSELRDITSLMHAGDEFDGLSDILFQDFKKNFMKDEDLDNVIKNKITNLEENNFLTQKSMYKELGIGELPSEYISLDQVTELIASLRERRIKIFKTLLKDYRKNKEKYIKFMKKVTKS